MSKRMSRVIQEAESPGLTFETAIVGSNSARSILYYSHFSVVL
jgi:hypothetical protein